MNFEPSLGYARPSKAFINIKLKTQNPVDGRQSSVGREFSHIRQPAELGEKLVRENV